MISAQERWEIDGRSCNFPTPSELSSQSDGQECCLEAKNWSTLLGTIRSMILLFVLYFAGLISVQRLSCDENIHDKSPIQNFPFSLHRSTRINGTIKKGQLNLHYANFEKSNELDLLRINVRLNDVNKSWDINKPLLQVTCQHPVDAVSFTLPTK
ncbi:unnamed protein product [Onchocerca flexuosa]|uniref:Neur_chan_LBD domain-containing protein n=1 Tax=Onchocerca flexuosa TaxID=387005 RepID=A0A183HGI5_9BILA|nr:unnamed protein product [Onchocerca flexuosa]